MSSLFFSGLSNDRIRTVKANFTNRGLSRIFNAPESVVEGNPDKGLIFDISTALSDVKVTKEPPVGFVSIPELLGIDYVGYKIEKERLDPATGNWRRIDEYMIIGAEATSFKDSRVAYGHQYRYRIKSIMKVTVKITKEKNENLELIDDIRGFRAEVIKDSLNSQKDILANIDRATNLGIQSKVSSGEQVTFLDVIDGLKVRADSERTELVSVPVVNPEVFMSPRRRRNSFSFNTDFIRGLLSEDSLQREVTENIINTKEQTVEYMSYYYESDPTKEWVYTNIVENVPPPYPSAIKIITNTPTKQILLTWLKPATSQRDIKYFRIYRRDAIGKEWQMLAELPESENFYIDHFTDKDVEQGRKVIYAFTCVDAHGMESFLSIQTQAQLNQNFTFEKKEKLLKWISGGGVRPDEFNTVLKKFLDQQLPVIARKNISLAPTQNFREDSKTLILRVKSLDTHEQKEFKVILKNSNAREQE
jgi:hypothetical protein